MFMRVVVLAGDVQGGVQRRHQEQHRDHTFGFSVPALLPSTPALSQLVCRLEVGDLLLSPPPSHTLSWGCHRGALYPHIICRCSHRINVPDFQSTTWYVMEFSARDGCYLLVREAIDNTPCIANTNKTVIMHNSCTTDAILHGNPGKKPLSSIWLLYYWLVWFAML